MVCDETLEGEYLRAVNHDGRYHRLLAGPGTGKTYTLMQKVCRLLERDENPRRMLLLTFTRIAARDLKRQLLNLGQPQAEFVRSGTLHSVAFSILANERVIQQMNREPRPLLKFELKPLRHDLAHGLGIGLTPIGEFQELYESAWARLQTDDPGWAPTPEARRFERSLIDWLKFHRAMLIGETIPLCLRYLQINPENQFQNAFEHVFVDEYQDLNRAEQVLVDEITGAGNLTIGGDDEQSLYSFKFADPSGILSFNQTHENTFDSTLNQSRRCPIRILQIANHLMGHIEGEERYVQHLGANPDGEIYVLQWNGMVEEATGLSTIIRHYQENRDIDPGRTLILVQRSQLADRIKSNLLEMDLPVISYFSNPLDNLESQRRFALLSFAADNSDRVALRFWLGCGSNTFLRGSYARLIDYCSRNQIEPLDALRLLNEGEIHIPRTQVLIPRYIDLLEQSEPLHVLNGTDLIDRIFPIDIPDCVQIRQLALNECDGDVECAEMISRIRERLTQPLDVPEIRDSISIMSLHKAKGLEADMVIIASCVEGLIPYIDADSTPIEQRNQMEENRRLFYVGITRTKNILFISNFLYIPTGQAERMRLNYQTVRRGLGRVQASSFIHDLGPECPRPVRGMDFVNDL